MGLIVYIYKSKLYKPPAQNVVSARYDEAVLIDAEGPFHPDDKMPALRLVHRRWRSGTFVHAEPIDPVPRGHVGYMFGGTFIHSSDSRFPNPYPIPLHDRTETQAQYDVLTRD
jgi:hypothetical protein